MDDSKIVELFLRRDENAIRHTKEKYGRRLRDLSYGVVRDAQTAEGCENDTYLAAWNAIPPHAPCDYVRLSVRISRPNRAPHFAELLPRSQASEAIRPYL